ncbi:MAG: hypothetical protein IJ787_00975 [Bacilli bacterium]|nr:hypothetical protein [Bacilli bacterium]
MELVDEILTSTGETIPAGSKGVISAENSRGETVVTFEDGRRARVKVSHMKKR